MGPCYIRIAQTLNNRYDLFPVYFLYSLRDAIFRYKVNKRDLQLIEDLLNQYMIIHNIDPASASILNYGSVAVVYKVFLSSINENIALKITNPRYYEYIMQDKPYFANSILGKDIDRYINEYITNQLNTKSEVTTQESFYMFSWTRSGKVRVPKLYYALCSENVIAMEYIPGKTFAQLERENKLHESLSREMIYNLITFLIYSIYELKMIHMDMHMGNLMLHEEENIIYCIDYGWVSVVNDYKVVLRIIYAFATKNMSMFGDSLSSVLEYNHTDSPAQTTQLIRDVLNDTNTNTSMLNLAQLIRDNGWSIKSVYVPILIARINAIAVYKSLCQIVDEETLMDELSKQMITSFFSFFSI
jgi:predicted unusual protein kinase regulating ubiquinone biosynthesis (AarF/ABC1/UbiB family)